MPSKQFSPIQVAVLGFALSLMSLAPPASAQSADQDWSQTLTAAAGQTVFFNAWGGDERINAYIAWAGDRVKEDHGVTRSKSYEGSFSSSKYPSEKKNHNFRPAHHGSRPLFQVTRANSSIIRRSSMNKGQPMSERTRDEENEMNETNVQQS